MKWLIGAIALLSISIVLGLQYVVLVLYALIAAILFCRMLTRRWIDQLEAKRTCQKYSLTEGQTLAVAVEIKNTGRLPILWCLIEDRLPDASIRPPGPRVTTLGPRLRATSLRKNQRETLFYQIRFNRRGYYEIGPLVMETGDLFGLFRRVKTVTRPHYVLVYPDVVPLDGWEISSRRPVGEVKMGQRLMEDPTRIAGVRAYQPGDPLNLVHWKTTARTGQLHTKLLEPSTVAGATILLDYHVDTYSSANVPLRSELAVTAAASIANALYLMGKPVGLLTNGHDLAAPHRLQGAGHEYASREQAQLAVRADELAVAADGDTEASIINLPADRSPEQLMRVLEMLACVERSDRRTLAEALLENSGRIARDTTILAILGEVSMETALALGSLRRRGFAVRAIVNCYYDHELEKAAGMLMTEGIEVSMLRDRDSITDICRRMLLTL